MERREMKNQTGRGGGVGLASQNHEKNADCCFIVILVGNRHQRNSVFLSSANSRAGLSRKTVERLVEGIRLGKKQQCDNSGCVGVA